jgi:FkbM family methyltransferase
MIPFNITVPTRWGPMTVHRFDQYVGQSLDRYGEFSKDEVDFLLELVGPGSIVIDGGANLGALTIPLAKRVGQYGHVYAFEPQHLTFQALAGNCAINSLPNVTTLNQALGRAPARIKMRDLNLTEPLNVGGRALKADQVGRPVNIIRIDDLNLMGCSLIKLDLEGMEREAIAGARKTIKDCQPLLYVESDRVEHRDGLLQDLKGFGYKCFLHQPPLFNVMNWRGDQGNIFTTTVSVNILAVPGHDTRDWGAEPL